MESKVITIQRFIRGYLIRKNNLLNLDVQLLTLRDKVYQSHRKQVFVDMAQKHYNKMCLCTTKGKQCECSGSIKLHKFGDFEYLSKLYDSGRMDAIYNIIQSTTQNLRTRTGKDFERLLEKLFKEYSIPFYSQVFVDNTGIMSPTRGTRNGKNKGFTVDFMIPPPKFGTNIKKYKGDIVSAKTTIRERFNQDKFLSTKRARLVVISLEKIENTTDILSVKIDPDTKELTKYILFCKAL